MKCMAFGALMALMMAVGVTPASAMMMIRGNDDLRTVRAAVTPLAPGSYGAVTADGKLVGDFPVTLDAATKTYSMMSTTVHMFEGPAVVGAEPYYIMQFCTPGYSPACGFDLVTVTDGVVTMLSLNAKTGPETLSEGLRALLVNEPGDKRSWRVRSAPDLVEALRLLKAGEGPVLVANKLGLKPAVVPPPEAKVPLPKERPEEAPPRKTKVVQKK